jgi:hypothetical protein
MIFLMKRQFFTKALTFGLSAVASAAFLTSCETTENRISGHPDIYQSLSPRDQALVSRSEIRTGMSQNAVWLAWGSPEQKTTGAMRGHDTETWIYVWTRSAPYGSAYYPGYGYGYGGYGPGFGYGGFGGVGVIRSHGRHGRFAVFGDPFYDPFFYDPFPTVTYPYKVVTFSSGRVMSYQYLVPHSGPSGPPNAQ